MEEKEKLSNRLKAAILKDFRSENIECSKYQLIFVSAEEVLSKPILFWLKKNCFTVSLIGSTCVCFRWITVLPVFNLTHFDLLPVAFPEMQWHATNQGVFFFSTASSCRCLLALPPPPTPTVHSNSKSNTACRINDREFITLAGTNKTPALQARSSSKGSFT